MRANRVMAAGSRPVHFPSGGSAPSRWSLRPVQMVRSWRRPIRPTRGPANLAGPVSVTSQSQEKRVPAGVGSHWMWPCDGGAVHDAV